MIFSTGKFIRQKEEYKKVMSNYNQFIVDDLSYEFSECISL